MYDWIISSALLSAPLLRTLVEGSVLPFFVATVKIKLRFYFLVPIDLDNPIAPDLGLGALPGTFPPLEGVLASL